MIVYKIKKLFPTIKEDSDIIKKESEILIENNTFEELLNQLRDYKDEDKDLDDKWITAYNYYMSNENWKYKLVNSLKAISYTNMPERINKENIDVRFA